MSLANLSIDGKDESKHVDLKTARLKAVKRKSANRVRMLHHNAYRCINAEETRHFYEDLLGMPLVAALHEPLNAITGEPDPYVHLYFELGDGSTIAFFDYPGFYAREKVTFESRDPYLAHIALEVVGMDAINDIIEIYKRENIAHFPIDHGYCYSIYCHDPNGMVLEFSTNVEISEQFFCDATETAHEDLKRWMKIRETVVAGLDGEYPPKAD